MRPPKLKNILQEGRKIYHFKNNQTKTLGTSYDKDIKPCNEKLTHSEYILKEY